MTALSPSPTDWLDVHAGAVQGMATIILILLTIWYAWNAQRQAKLTDREVQETIRSRRQTLQPAIYILWVTAEQKIEPDRTTANVTLIGETGLVSPERPVHPGDLLVKFGVKNFGPGPALSTRAAFSFPGLVTAHTPGAYYFDPSELSSDIRLDPPTQVAIPVRAEQQPSQEAFLWLEYQDIFGRWWTTRAPITVGWTRTENGSWMCSGLTVSTQRQEIRLVAKNHFLEDRLAVDWPAVETSWRKGKPE